MSWDEGTASAKVLIVDDTQANLIALEAALGPLDVRIVAARSGTEALELIQTTPFAVALVDVQMPGMDGFELTQHARKTKLGRELPIIFVTAVHSDEACMRRGYASGAADYITKPYDAQIVRARVKAFVDLYEQREAVRRGQVALRTQERDEATRRMVAFERIASAALETNDLNALLDELLRAFIGAADAADSAAILLRDGDYLSVAAAIGLDPELRETLRTRVGRGFAGLVAAQRKPLEVVGEGVTELVQSTPLQQPPSVIYGVPLLHDGQLVGVAQIGSRRAPQFSGAEKRLFEAAAERAALAVAKQQQVSALNEILDTAPAYVAIVNSDTLEYSFANPMLRELMQAPLVGAKLDERAWGQAIGWALGKARMGQPTFIDELSIRGSEGRRTTFLQLNVQPLRSSAGAVDRLLLFATDITAQVSSRKQLERAELERVRLLERERRARSAAELASLAKDEFLATVSHELRTPLSAILGWSSLARSRSRTDVDGALAIIERNARAQARIVEDVLDFSGMSRGKMRLSLTQVDLRDVAKAAVESVRPAADAKNIRIEARLDESCRLLGDPGRLQQVVWNLLNNAVKYTGQGGQVRLWVESLGGVRRLSVEDTGQGIDADFLPHVFEAFRQANGSTTRRHGGLGLGLAIVHQIVQAHGGTIEARSDGLGRGACFTVELLAEGNPAASSAQEVEPAPDTLPDARIRLDGLKVLIVDDDADGREFMAQVLAEHGAVVSAFPTARLALSEFARLRPDVLVSDIAMPTVDGYELIRQVRALDPEAGGQTPALAVTAHAGKEVMDRVLQSGFQRYTAKPLDVPDLLVCVAELAQPADEKARRVSH
jgi:signal transduction histidine kinase/DNA-binding response OmpR family regulator